VIRARLCPSTRNRRLVSRPCLQPFKPVADERVPVDADACSGDFSDRTTAALSPWIERARASLVASFARCVTNAEAITPPPHSLS